MSAPVILASSSAIRASLLTQAGVPHGVQPVRLDEEAIIQSLLAEGCKADEIADALAEAKARRASANQPQAYVIGCDQVLEIDGQVLQKPRDPEQAAAQLALLNGRTHRLLTAAVIYHNGQPQWRHTGIVRLTMRKNSPEYLRDYLARNWESIRHAVGCYKLEEEGVRLFARVEGDYFHILGLPLIELLGYLTAREVLPG